MCFSWQCVKWNFTGWLITCSCYPWLANSKFCFTLAGIASFSVLCWLAKNCPTILLAGIFIFWKSCSLAVKSGYFFPEKLNINIGWGKSTLLVFTTLYNQFCEKKVVGYSGNITAKCGLLHVCPNIKTLLLPLLMEKKLHALYFFVATCNVYPREII